MLPIEGCADFATSILSNSLERRAAFKHIFQSKAKPWLSEDFQFDCNNLKQ